MGYRRNNYNSHYRRRSYPSYTSKKSSLSSSLGGVWQEILKDFFSLSENNLQSLFLRYKKEHGANSATYAKNTYPKWKSGATKTSGQTVERLVNLVPRYLSTERRLQLLDMMISHNKRHQTNNKSVSIDVMNPAEGISKLNEALDSLSPKDILATIPESVFNVAQWLYDDDITAVRGLMSQSHAADYKISRDNAERTVKSIHQTIASARTEENTFTDAEHKVSFSTGVVSIRIFKHIPKQKSSTGIDCFIATEVYGNPYDPRVVTLRLYRDNCLAKTSVGQGFISWYYKNGPRMANKLKNKSLPKLGIRMTLNCLVKVIKVLKYDR